MRLPLLPLIRPVALAVLLAGCVEHPPVGRPGGASAAPLAASEVPRSLGEETRAVLDQLVAVDTSHGHETDVLKPVADRLRAFLPVELVESTAGRGSLVARYKGSGAKRPLLLIAHV